MLALSEKKNRIRVGVEDERYFEEVLKAANRAEVPEEVLYIETRERFKFEQNIQNDAIRPVLGGTGISAPGDDLGDSYNCTKTLNFDWGDNETWLTNSHCTELGWQVNNDLNFYQPNAQEDSDVVGNEVFDPHGWPCTIDGDSYDCRYSDAAVIEVSNEINRNKGSFARTEYYGESSSGSLSKTTDFIIRDYTDGAFTGNDVHKVGATTGWTKGEVVETCVDLPIGPTNLFASNNVAFLCQYEADYYSEPGDSGSPVFRRNLAWQNPDEVALVGIHVGQFDGNRVYSPMDGVLDDLETSDNSFNILDHTPRPYLGHSTSWSGGCDHPRIFWDEIDEVDEYEIQRSTDEGFSWVHVNTISNSDYTDDTICDDIMALDNNQPDYEIKYSYRVRSLGDDGISAWSDVVHFGTDESENGGNGDNGENGEN